MLIDKIFAAEAFFPFDGFDSTLEKPSGQNPDQNAWLTIDLKLKLNFVDSKNPGGNLVKRGTKYFARDADGYYFPALDWPAHFRAKFIKKFQVQAEKFWNWQFVLITPKDYPDLDVTSFAGSGWRVRPNVLCLFRLNLIDSGFHQVVTVYNLKLDTKVVFNDAGESKDVSDMDCFSFRSDSANYDDRDLLSPAFVDPESRTIHDTVAHEIGHAIGQSHILGLRGDPTCKIGAPGSNRPYCYGTGSGNTFDHLNVMGAGNRVYLENAISWKKRIALHTGRPAADWQVTGIMKTPPRRIPMGVDMLGGVTVF